MVLGFELGTFCLLIRCSTTGPHLQPFCFSYCLNGVSCFCQGLASDHNPSSSTSHVAATAGMHHHVQPLSSLKYIIHIFFHVFFMSEYLVLTVFYSVYEKYGAASFVLLVFSEEICHLHCSPVPMNVTGHFSFGMSDCFLCLHFQDCNDVGCSRFL
jgi:hypothetical protein